MKGNHKIMSRKHNQKTKQNREVFISFCLGISIVLNMGCALLALVSYLFDVMIVMSIVIMLLLFAITVYLQNCETEEENMNKLLRENQELKEKLKITKKEEGE